MGLLSKLFGSREIQDNPQPAPTYDVPSTTSGNFHFVVEAVFTIIGRGTVVTGRVDSGEIHVGDTVNISGRLTTQVTGVEMFRQTLDVAKAGDNCGLLLKDVNRDDIHIGDYLTK